MISNGLCLANSSYLRDFFKTNNVKVYLESRCNQINEDSVVVATKDGVEEVKVDSVIMAVGYNPNPVAPKSKHTHIVGDALEVGNLRTVIWRAWDVALKI